MNEYERIGVFSFIFWKENKKNIYIFFWAVALTSLKCFMNDDFDDNNKDYGVMYQNIFDYWFYPLWCNKVNEFILYPILENVCYHVKSCIWMSHAFRHINSWSPLNSIKKGFYCNFTHSRRYVDPNEKQCRHIFNRL